MAVLARDQKLDSGYKIRVVNPRNVLLAWPGFGLPATTWMLEIGAFLLRTETELILKSRRVIPSRLLEAGFSFRFPEWSDAARDLVRRWRA